MRFSLSSAVLLAVAVVPAAVSATFVDCFPTSQLSQYPYTAYTNNTQNTASACEAACSGHGTLLALVGEACYCGSNYPDFSKAVQPSFCSTPCPGYTGQSCGGPGYLSLYSTG